MSKKTQIIIRFFGAAILIVILVLYVSVRELDVVKIWDMNQKIISWIGDFLIITLIITSILLCVLGGKHFQVFLVIISMLCAIGIFWKERSELRETIIKTVHMIDEYHCKKAEESLGSLIDCMERGGLCREFSYVFFNTDFYFQNLGLLYTTRGAADFERLQEALANMEYVNSISSDIGDVFRTDPRMDPDGRMRLAYNTIMMNLLKSITVDYCGKPLPRLFYPPGYTPY